MEAELASLSTIIIDSNGDPIGQVIYRCALCRKICDSSSEAMLHYQVDHIQLHQQQQQTLPASTTNHQALSHHANARSSSHQQRIHHSSGGSARHQQFATSSATSTANSLLKRATSSSLLKRASHGSLPSTSAAQNSLLKRGPNVMRCYDGTSTGSTGTKNTIRRQLNSSANKLENIHRQYTTTSASRAAKRHINPPKPNSTSTNNTTSASNISATVDASSTSTIKSNNSSSNAIEKIALLEKNNESENDDSNKSIKYEQTLNAPTIKPNLDATNSSKLTTNPNKSLSSKSQTSSQTKPSANDPKDQLSTKISTPEIESTKTKTSPRDSISSPFVATSPTPNTTPRRMTLTPKSYYNLRRRFNKNFKNKN